MNLYAYCRNHPVKYYDPSGYASCPAEALHGGEGNKWGSGAGESGRDAGTVWDNITPTQPRREGTQIPLSFNIDIDGQKFWVEPNGTKHMQEYVTRDGNILLEISLVCSARSSTGKQKILEKAFLMNNTMSGWSEKISKKAKNLD